MALIDVDIADYIDDLSDDQILREVESRGLNIVAPPDPVVPDIDVLKVGDLEAFKVEMLKAFDGRDRVHFMIMLDRLLIASDED